MKTNSLIVASFLLSISTFFYVAAEEQLQRNKNLDAYKEIIASSLSSVDKTQSGSWEYQINKVLTVDGKTNITIEKFSPDEDVYRQWFLEKINNKAPNNKQLEEYLADKREEIGEGILSKENNSLIKLIDINSLQIESDNNEIVQLSFNGFYPKFGDGAMGKIDGVLTLDLKNNYVTQIKLKNNEEFTARVILHIKQWKMMLFFDKYQETIVLKERQLNTKGTVAIFKDIEVSAHVIFDHYQLAEAVPE